MKPLDLFGTGIKSYSQIITAQRRVNCFYDIRKDGDKIQLVVRGTPGSNLVLTLPNSPIRGWRVVQGVLYVVGGAVLYSVTTAGVVTSLGTLALNNTQHVDMADNGVQLIMVDGVGGYILTLPGLVFSTITDVNFTNGATTVSFLDGRFQINQPNSKQYLVSASYDGTTWTPSLIGTKENTSDYLLAVQVNAGLLTLFGVQSMEFWQDTGSSPLPYTRINGASNTFGLAAMLSRAQLSITLSGVMTPVVIFLGKNPQGTFQVLMLSGYTPIVISDSDVENIINSFTTVSDAVAMSYVVDGHPMYQITFPTGGRSFLYDGLSSIWYEVQTGVALQAIHYAALGIAFNNAVYFSDLTTGNIYQLNVYNYTDNGTNIKRQITSRHIRNGGEKFSIDQIYLDMETGVGLQNGQGSAPQIMLQTSKDGGRTFGIERWKPIGKVGQFFSPRAVWNRLGASNDFVFQFTMTDPVKFVIAGGAATSIDEGQIRG